MAFNFSTTKKAVAVKPATESVGLTIPTTSPIELQDAVAQVNAAYVRMNEAQRRLESVENVMDNIQMAINVLSDPNVHSEALEVLNADKGLEEAIGKSIDNLSREAALEGIGSVIGSVLLGFVKAIKVLLQVILSIVAGLISLVGILLVPVFGIGIPIAALGGGLFGLIWSYEIFSWATERLGNDLRGSEGLAINAVQSQTIVSYDTMQKLMKLYDSLAKMTPRDLKDLDAQFDRFIEEFKKNPEEFASKKMEDVNDHAMPYLKERFAGLLDVDQGSNGNLKFEFADAIKFAPVKEGDTWQKLGWDGNKFTQFMTWAKTAESEAKVMKAACEVETKRIEYFLKTLENSKEMKPDHVAGFRFITNYLVSLMKNSSTVMSKIIAVANYNKKAITKTAEVAIKNDQKLAAAVAAKYPVKK